MNKIGVVIPFFGGNHFLPLLLQSIHSISISYEINIYIIDNSRDSERFDRYLTNSFKNIFIIDAGVAIGYGRACNIGYQRCLDDGCDVLVVVNQDGYFSAGSLALIINSLLNESDYIVSVPLLTKYENDEVEWFFTHVYLTPMESLVSDLFRGKVKPFYQIQQLCGACFALKIKDYHSFHYLFDELFYMYFEDTDLYKRLERLNKKVMLVPGALFHHKHGNTTSYERDSIKSKTIWQTSKHIYHLKQCERSLFYAIPGWILLNIRNMIANLLSLKLKDFFVDLLSFISVVIRLNKINNKIYFERSVKF